MPPIPNFDAARTRAQLTAWNTGLARRLRLARAICSLDQSDEKLHKSGMHRKTLSNLTSQQTVHVLYHMHLDVITAMIEGNYNQLARSCFLPIQLTEVLTDDTAFPTAKDPKM